MRGTAARFYCSLCVEVSSVLPQLCSKAHSLVGLLEYPSLAAHEENRIFDVLGCPFPALKTRAVMRMLTSVPMSGIGCISLTITMPSTAKPTVISTLARTLLPSRTTSLTASSMLHTQTQDARSVGHCCTRLRSLFPAVRCSLSAALDALAC